MLGKDWGVGSVRGAETRKKKEGSLVFPNDGSTVECFWGSAVIGGWRSGWFGGGGFGDGEGRRSAVQRLAFCIVGQAGIKVLCAAEWSL